MKTLELNTLPTPVLLVWDRGHVVVDGYGQYCPNCNKDQLFDSNTLCVACGGHSAAGDFCSDEFNDEEYEKGKIKLYELIGKLSELTEEQAKELVKQVDWYYNYNHSVQARRIMFDTALESFHSAIESEGYYMEDVSNEAIEKELGIYGHDIGLTESEYQDWIKENESKILPANTLILKKS